MPAAKPRKIEYSPLAEIGRAPRNSKDHDEPGIGASIGRFGFIEAMIMDERTGCLVGGHGRLDELQRREASGEDAPEGIVVIGGKWTAPVQRGWSSRSDEEALAAGIALNRIGERGGWHTVDLYEDLTLLASMDEGLVGIGFDAADLERAVAAIELDKRDLDTSGGDGSGSGRITVPAHGDEVTKRGDVWLLGEHRVMCGDCRNAEDVARLLDGDTVNLAFTSPPYAEQRDYDETSGFKPIPPDEYVEWFAPVADNVAQHLAEDGSWFVNIKPTANDLDTELYVLDLVIAHVREWGWHFATEFCWQRVGVPKRVSMRFKNQFEPVYQFARGRWKMRADNVRFPSDAVPVPAGPGIGASLQDEHQGAVGDGGLVLGAAKKWAQKERESAYEYPPEGNYPENQGTGAPLIAPRKRPDDVPDADMQEDGLAYPGNRLPTFSGTHEAVGHAAAFPVGLPAWFVRAYTDAGDVIYDPFVGSGSTLLAAAAEKRAGRGMELSPGYVDVVCARWQRATGGVPVLDGGAAHDFLAD